MAILFIENDIVFKLKKKEKIRSWILSIIAKYKKKPGDISFIFCDDNFILDTNIKYLNHNYYTDIITFDYSDQLVLSGDIFVSIDTVKTNSIQYCTSFEDELYRVIIHGILHLIGFKDKTKKERVVMQKAENDALEIFRTI